MNITEEQFQELIAMLAQIETTGRVNFVPVLGSAGAEEAFFIMQEFIANLEKQALAKEKTLQALHSENERLGLYKDAYAQPEHDYERGFIDGMQKQMQSSVDKAVNRMAQPEQEPVALPCCGYADSSAIKWNSYNQVVQCHNCGQDYTHPQRTCVGLAAEDRLTAKYMQDAPDGIEAVIDYIEAKLKEKNNG